MTVRERGSYWFHNAQMKLEKQKDIEIGKFYCFLRDEFADGVFWYGNIYMGDHWIMHRMALPTGVIPEDLYYHSFEC